MTKKRILIVDDDGALTGAMRRNLLCSGHYDVAEENLGRQAVSTAKAFKPDLVLMDIMMPDVDGDMVASWFAADPELVDIPIVFLTGLASGATKGVDGSPDYLPKPVEFALVTACIESHLGKPD